jgi:hypothetical protein
LVEEEVSGAGRAGFRDFETGRFVRAGLEGLPGSSGVLGHSKGSLEPAKGGKGGRNTHGRMDFPARVDYWFFCSLDVSNSNI